MQGRSIPVSLQAESRTMDRANNATGLRIGATAEAPLDVIAAAQAEIERAFQSGPSIGGRAHWLPPGAMV